MKAIGNASRPDEPVCRANSDFAGVGLVDAGQDFDQRRFAGAVLAQQRVDLAAADVEIDVIEREGPGEALDESGHRRSDAAPNGRVNRIHDRSFRLPSSIDGWLDPQRLSPPGRLKLLHAPDFR